MRNSYILFLCGKESRNDTTTYLCHVLLTYKYVIKNVALYVRKSIHFFFSFVDFAAVADYAYGNADAAAADAITLPFFVVSCFFSCENMGDIIDPLWKGYSNVHY